MILAVQIYLRGFVHKCILRPRIKDPSKTLIQMTETNKANLKLLASIIYHIIMGIVKEVPVVPNNQAHLFSEEQVRPAQPLFAGTSN